MEDTTSFISRLASVFNNKREETHNKRRQRLIPAVRWRWLRPSFCPRLWKNLLVCGPKSDELFPFLLVGCCWRHRVCCLGCAIYSAALWSDWPINQSPDRTDWSIRRKFNSLTQSNSSWFTTNKCFHCSHQQLARPSLVEMIRHRRRCHRPSVHKAYLQLTDERSHQVVANYRLVTRWRWCDPWPSLTFDAHQLSITGS